MVADPREMQENQGFSENRIDKLEFVKFQELKISLFYINTKHNIQKEL